MGSAKRAIDQANKIKKPSKKVDPPVIQPHEPAQDDTESTKKKHKSINED